MKFQAHPKFHEIWMSDPTLRRGVSRRVRGYVENLRITLLDSWFQPSCIFVPSFERFLPSTRPDPQHA